MPCYCHMLSLPPPLYPPTHPHAPRSPQDALLFAMDAQLALLNAPWPPEVLDHHCCAVMCVRSSETATQILPSLFGLRAPRPRKSLSRSPRRGDSMQRSVVTAFYRSGGGSMAYCCPHRTCPPLSGPRTHNAIRTACTYHYLDRTCNTVILTARSYHYPYRTCHMCAIFSHRPGLFSV